MSDFKFNSAEVKPISRTEVADETPRPQPAAPVYVTDADADLRALCQSDPRRARLTWLADRLHLAVFWNSLYSEAKDGWHFTNKQTGVRSSLTFDEVSVLIDARLTELGLDRSIVEAWGAAHSSSIGEYQARLRMSFDERIASFRVRP